jgi:hypothetical protein
VSRNRGVIVTHFTALEQAALKEICKQQLGERGRFERQLASAVVSLRENSGAGFFTHLTVDRTTQPLTKGGRVLGNVAATIEGLEQPLLLMLFMKDGYADMLEGATVDDCTLGLDLSALKFEINPN